MSVTIDWNREKDLMLLNGIAGKKNKPNHYIQPRNIKVKSEIKSIITNACNSSLVPAMLQARVSYLNRKPESFANVPIDSKSKQLKKRHCVRYVGSEPLQMLTMEKLPKTFSVPISLTKLFSQCTIVDSVNYQNEWWIYILSSKAIKTFTVCDFIYEICALNDGFFFTDEIPGGRGEVKRYEYTKLQHFKHCISELHSIKANNNIQDPVAAIKIEMGENCWSENSFTEPQQQSVFAQEGVEVLMFPKTEAETEMTHSEKTSWPCAGGQQTPK